MRAHRHTHTHIYIYIYVCIYIYILYRIIDIYIFSESACPFVWSLWWWFWCLFALLWRTGTLGDQWHTTFLPLQESGYGTGGLVSFDFPVWATHLGLLSLGLSGGLWFGSLLTVLILVTFCFAITTRWTSRCTGRLKGFSLGCHAQPCGVASPCLANSHVLGLFANHVMWPDHARPVYSHSIDGSGTVRCALHDLEVARAITYQYVKLGLPHHISAQSHQHAVGPRCQASNVQPWNRATSGMRCLRWRVPCPLERGPVNTWKLHLTKVLEDLEDLGGFGLFWMVFWKVCKVLEDFPTGHWHFWEFQLESSIWFKSRWTNIHIKLWPPNGSGTLKVHRCRCHCRCSSKNWVPWLIGAIGKMRSC